MQKAFTQQKKLIVVALAAVTFSASALAETANVSFYGAVDMAYGITNNGAVSVSQISSQVTKLGFKGSEGLDDGLAAIWQIEQQIDIDSAGTGQSTKNTLASRNSFVGLKSDSMGTVLLGRHDTPYKIATRKLDLFADQLADNRSLMGGGAAANKAGLHDARLTDEVVYLSQKMNGFSAAAAYAAGAETATTAAQIKGSAWSLAGMYDQGPFYGSLAYQKFNYGTAGTGQFALAAPLAAGDSLKAWKLGGSYKMDAFQLNGVYEKTTSSVGGLDTLGRTNWHLGGIYNFGNNDVKLAYTRAGKTNNVANSEANQVSLGYDHNLSKRTTIYAQYTKLSNKAAASFGLTNAGSTAGGAAASAAGVSPYGFGLGMKHTF